MGILLTITSLITVIKIVETALGDSGRATREEYCQAWNRDRNKQGACDRTLEKQGETDSNKGRRNSRRGSSSVASDTRALDGTAHSSRHHKHQHNNNNCYYYYAYDPARVLNSRTTKHRDALRKAVVLEQASRHLAATSRLARCDQFVTAVKQEYLFD